MTIAVPIENGRVYAHFGHAEQFKIYQVEGGKIVSSRIVDAGGAGHGALAAMLAELDVDTLICGGIGQGARDALDEAGVGVFGGVDGSADAAVQAMIEDALAYDPDARCAHHDHADHACGSGACSCGGGDHDCGGNCHCGE